MLQLQPGGRYGRKANQNELTQPLITAESTEKA
jgi:hypothetical protein